MSSEFRPLTTGHWPLISGHRSLTTLLLLLLAPLAGCFVGDYQTRMEKSVSEHRKGEVFHRHLAPQPYDLPAIGVRIRLPKFFQPVGDNNFYTESDSTKLDLTYRVYPPEIKIPNLIYTREHQLLFNRSNYPVYLYFHLIPVKPPIEGAQPAKPEHVEKGVADIVRGKLTAAPQEWETVQLKRPDGSTVEYRRLSATGEQKFDLGETGEFRDYPGRFDLYLVSGPTHHLLVGWRAPEAVAGELAFWPSVEASMGTLEVREPEEPAAEEPKAEEPKSEGPAANS